MRQVAAFLNAYRRRHLGDIKANGRVGLQIDFAGAHFDVIGIDDLLALREPRHGCRLDLRLDFLTRVLHCVADHEH